MTTRTVVFESFSVDIEGDWKDITETLEDTDSPITFANLNSGVGALQFSVAMYRRGKLPDVSLGDLAELLRLFATNRGLGAPFDNATFPDNPFVLGESFRKGDDFIRVWYCSDGKNLVLATYICNWEKSSVEVEAAESIVRSISFICSNASN